MSEPMFFENLSGEIYVPAWIIGPLALCADLIRYGGQALIRIDDAISLSRNNHEMLSLLIQGRHRCEVGDICYE
jgi:hypothetical protein